MNASHFMTVPLLAIHRARDLALGPAQLGTVMAANLLNAQTLPLAAGLVTDRVGLTGLALARWFNESSGRGQ
jgi:hypothetical protein